MSERCIILGAGIAGLLAATGLQESGQSVRVIDKARGVGGRMATRRIGDATLDHGAQFFTVREKRFATWVSRWKSLGLVVEWSKGFADATGFWDRDGHPRYRGKQGMTSIAKSLAMNLDVVLSKRILAIEYDRNHWILHAGNKEHFEAQRLILTPPVPQTLNLFAAGGVKLDESTQETLEEIQYDRCIALLVVLKDQGNIPEPGGVQLPGEPISWIGDNFSKGISAQPGSVTIHAAPQFSLDNWDMDDDTVSYRLLEAAQPWLGSKPQEIQIHRWLYSKPRIIHPTRYLAIVSPGPAVFAGDAFGSARVEGAALSGLAAADYLIP